MKFQAVYTANAKIVTAIDEMIQTLLGLKNKKDKSWLVEY